MKIHAEPGEHISKFIERVIAHAKDTNSAVIMCHNGVNITVHPQSYGKDILNMWDLIRERDILQQDYDELQEVYDELCGNIALNS